MNGAYIFWRQSPPAFAPPVDGFELVHRGARVGPDMKHRLYSFVFGCQRQVGLQTPRFGNRGGVVVCGFGSCEISARDRRGHDRIGPFRSDHLPSGRIVGQNEIYVASRAGQDCNSSQVGRSHCGHRLAFVSRRLNFPGSRLFLPPASVTLSSITMGVFSTLSIRSIFDSQASAVAGMFHTYVVIVKTKFIDFDAASCGCFLWSGIHRFWG